MATGTVFLVEFEARAWPRYFASVAGGGLSSYYGRARIAVVPGVTYRITAQVRRASAVVGTFSLGVRCLDAAGAVLGGVPSAASAQMPSNVWAVYSGTCGATGDALPANTAFITPAWSLNFGSTAGQHHIKDLIVEDTAAPGVALNLDPQTRDLAHWQLVSGGAATVLTERIEAIPQTLALRYASGPYVSAAGDTPASMPYEARVLNPGMVRSELPADLAGPIASNFGEIVLSNADGALSDWPYHGLDGQQVSVYMGQADAARSTFVEVIRATIEQATVDRKVARLRLRGGDTRLDVPLNVKRYEGNNTGGPPLAGLDGTADDLKGRRKPMLLGLARSIAPPCVNTDRYIYQVTTGGVAGTGDILEVRVQGLPVTRGTVRADAATLESTTPTAGTYDLIAYDSIDGMFFRLGTAPAGLVTCDAITNPDGSPGAANLACVIAGMQGIVPAADATTAGATVAPNYLSDASQWEQATGPTAGVWVNDDKPAGALVQTLCKSIGAWYGHARWGGIFSGALEWGIEVFHLEPGALTAAIDLSSAISITALAAPGAGRGVPVWRVAVRYRPRATLQIADFAAGVTQADRAMLQAPYLEEEAITDLLLIHPNAREFVRDTVVDSAAVAASEATRLLELLSYSRLWFEVCMALEAAMQLPEQPRLGGFVKLQWPTLRVLSRAGETTDSGVFVVMAIEVDLSRLQVRMTVRQATETAA